MTLIMHTYWKSKRWSLVVFFVCLTAIVSADCVAAQEPLHETPATPSGWRKKAFGSKGYTAFTKLKTRSTNVLTVKYYQRLLLESVKIEDWLLNRLATGNAPDGGKWVSDPEVVRYSRNMVSGSRKYKSKTGQRRSLTGLAVCVDQISVRLAATQMSDNAETKKTEKEAIQLMFKLVETEKKSAVAEKRGLSLEVAPPKVKGIKVGIPLQPGRYVGTRVRKGEVTGTCEVVLHGNGEYEFVKGFDEKNGQITYSQATGRLNLAKDFYNSTYSPDEDYCVYGNDSKGKPMIFAHEDGGFANSIWRLKYKGESDRDSPSQRDATEKMAIAEANRYKHVTEPGKGVRPNEIEAVLYSFESMFRSGAYQVDYEGYLLMKDGRVMDGLPVAPDTLDVVKSRSREPNRWGWWRKAENGDYEFAWPVRPKEYVIPKGTQIIGIPFKKGSRLEGDWGSASTSANITSGYSSVRWWGIVFSKNGRFQKRKSGSTQSGGVGVWETLVTTVHDDKGSSTSISGPYVVGGSSRKSNRPGSERMGTYEFDGYRLTLKYDNGMVRHLATFTYADGSSIWFEGHSLSKEKKKEAAKKKPK